jgi:hypothetical protein
MRVGRASSGCDTRGAPPPWHRMTASCLRLIISRGTGKGEDNESCKQGETRDRCDPEAQSLLSSSAAHQSLLLDFASKGALSQARALGRASMEGRFLLEQAPRRAIS